MRVSRRHRGWLSGWLIALLLFTQWATLAHGCQRLDGATRGAAGVGTIAAMPECAENAPGTEAAQASLCKAHCEVGQQSVNTAGAGPDAPAALALAWAVVGVLDVAEAAERAAVMPLASGTGPPIGTLPLYLSLLVLRN